MGSSWLMRTQCSCATVSSSSSAAGSRPRPGTERRSSTAPAAPCCPGLIDAHTHLLSVEDLEQAVVFGVTTELDMFCPPVVLDPLTRAAAAARDDVADVRSAGVGATVPEGHPTQLTRWGYPEFPTLDDPAAAEEFVAARKAEGSDYLKILIEDGSCFGVTQPAVSPELVAALVTAARTYRLRTVAHISRARDAEMALSAGVDGLAQLTWAPVLRLSVNRARRSRSAPPGVLSPRVCWLLDPTSGACLSPPRSVAVAAALQARRAPRARRRSRRGG